MPKLSVDLSIDDLAQTIAHLSEEERETLAILLSDAGAELLQRTHDLDAGTATTLSEAEVFDS